jgi:hypothetical protein
MRETLDAVLAAWWEETPVPEEVQRLVEAELDDARVDPTVPRILV